MKFRPCIDIHNGVVKQIIGSTLSDETVPSTESSSFSATPLVENFVATKSAAEYAATYRADGLTGGHVIMLGPGCEQAAREALGAYPQGLQVGGGITVDNALSYLEAGASHVVVTSFVFREGEIQFERLESLVSLVGKDRLVSNVHFVVIENHYLYLPSFSPYSTMYCVYMPIIGRKPYFLFFYSSVLLFFYRCWI